MKRFWLLFLVIIFVSATKGLRLESQVKALETARAISTVGVLQEKKNGYLYLDLPNEFIFKTGERIKLSGNFTSKHITSKTIGAHISVITEEERALLNGKKIQEIGKEFSFHVREFQSFQALGTRVWVIVVDSPELESFRISYGLKPKLKGHDFHITIGEDFRERLFYKKKFRKAA